MSGEVSCPIDDPIDEYQCNLTGMCKVGLTNMLNAKAGPCFCKVTANVSSG